jgi:hypothetical protein
MTIPTMARLPREILLLPRDRRILCWSYAALSFKWHEPKAAFANCLYIVWLYTRSGRWAGLGGSWLSCVYVRIHGFNVTCLTPFS